MAMPSRHSFVIAVPSTCGDRKSPPAMFRPATRPWRLAYVPSAMYTGWPVTRWVDSAQSPADQTPSTDVACRSSTRIASATPISMPAAAASSERGRTPMPSTTRSASNGPSDVSTLPGSKPSTSTFTGRPCRDPRGRRRRVGRSRRRASRAAGPLPFDDRRRAAPLDERLGELQPDVPAAHHDDTPATLLGERQQHLGVLQGLHAPYERQVDARQVGSDRRAAGGDEQLVVAEAERRPGSLVEHLDDAGCRVDGDGLVVDAHVDAAPAVLVRAAGDERLDAARDHAADDERDPTRRVAREPARLQRR